MRTIPGTGSVRILLMLGLSGLVLSGCAGIEPWVAPYERDRLADPIMSFERDPASAAYSRHVYDAREAARGASGGSGAGCGCN